MVGQGWEIIKSNVVGQGQGKVGDRAGGWMVGGG